MREIRRKMAAIRKEFRRQLHRRPTAGAIEVTQRRIKSFLVLYSRDLQPRLNGFRHHLATGWRQYSLATAGQKPDAFVLLGAIKHVNAITSDRVIDSGILVLLDKFKKNSSRPGSSMS